MLMLCYIYVIVIYDGVRMGHILSILCRDLFLTLLKIWLTQQIVEVYEDTYKDLMEEGATYSASGVVIDGGKWYLQCINCVVESFVRGILEVEVL